MHFKGVTSIYVSFIILPLIAIFTSCTAETKEVEILNEKNQVIEKYSIDPVTKYKEGENLHRHDLPRIHTTAVNKQHQQE